MTSPLPGPGQDSLFGLPTDPQAVGGAEGHGLRWVYPTDLPGGVWACCALPGCWQHHVEDTPAGRDAAWPVWAAHARTMADPYAGWAW